MIVYITGYYTYFMIVLEIIVEINVECILTYQ